MSNSNQNPETTKPSQIYACINLALKQVSSVKKDGTNTMQNYKYKTIEAVIKAVNQAIASNNLILQVQVLENDITTGTAKSGGTVYHYLLKVGYNLICTTDGSSLKYIVLGEGVDNSDKGMNKAMTSALKNFLLQAFLLETDDEKRDSEVDSIERPAIKENGNVQFMTEQEYKSLLSSNNKLLIANALNAKVTKEGVPFRIKGEWRGELQLAHDKL